jgi:hypothetical protein
MTMKKAMYLFILIAAMGLTLMFTACEKKGPAEKAGEQIDQTMEKTEETLEDAMEPAGPMEKAGEKIDNVAEETKEVFEEAGK